MKKIKYMLLIISTILTILFTNLNIVEAQNKQYSTLTEFEKQEGWICEAATDGCNSLIMEEWKVVGSTKMYCENHTPIYSCTHYKKNHDNLIKDKDIRICTMQYEPVCWVDWVTYWNTCSAWDVKIAYKWECSWELILVDTEEEIKKMTQQYLGVFEKNKIENALKKVEKKIKNIKDISTRENLIYDIKNKIDLKEEEILKWRDIIELNNKEKYTYSLLYYIKILFYDITDKF